MWGVGTGYRIQVLRTVVQFYYKMISKLLEYNSIFYAITDTTMESVVQAMKKLSN